MTKYSGVRRSMEIYEQAGELIPGWTQLISRRASQFAAGVSPAYAREAKGSRFTDVDGNEYIDWVNCVGAIILGHADQVVNDAVKEQIDRGSIYTVNSPKEVELAEELIDTTSHPSAPLAFRLACMSERLVLRVMGKDRILYSKVFMGKFQSQLLRAGRIR